MVYVCVCFKRVIPIVNTPVDQNCTHNAHTHTNTQTNKSPSLATGVYIDQLGAASPTLDFGNHSHAKGGGSWWVKGISDMMKMVAAKTAGAPMVTESNAEPFMTVVQG